MPHTVEVFHQACFFLGAFYCTHIWSTSNRIMQTISGGGSVFPLLLLHSFFDPFQGFLNYVVYQRPRYLQIRQQRSEVGRLGAIRRTLHFSFTTRKNRASHQTNQSRNVPATVVHDGASSTLDVTASRQSLIIARQPHDLIRLEHLLYPQDPDTA
jgi:hypothetical protein